MSGYAGGYAIAPFPTGPGVGTEAADKAVLYWDATGNQIKGSSDFVFNETLKQLLLPSGSRPFPSLTFGADTDTGMFLDGTYGLSFSTGSVVDFCLNGYGAVVHPTRSFGFGSQNDTAGSVPDVRLWRDAAGVLAQRNGVNAQEFRVYNTYTDASNFERGFVRWSGSAFQVGPTYSGTGAARNMHVGGDCAIQYFRGGGDYRLMLNAAGFYPYPHAAIANEVSLGYPGNGWKESFFGGKSASLIPIQVKAHASQSANLQEWQNSSGTALLKVDKDGNIDGRSITAYVGNFYAYGATANPLVASVAGSGLFLSRDEGLWWSSDASNALPGTYDLILRRDAAGVLTQRNGTNEQLHAVYKSYTDANNYERMMCGYTITSGIGFMGGEKKVAGAVADGGRVILHGSGNAQGLELRPRWDLTTGSWNFTTTALAPAVDANTDLGTSSLRVRTGYFGGVAAIIPLVVKAHASQTANLQEWQNSSGTAIAYVEKGGAIKSLGLIEAVVAKTANYTATINDHVIKCSASGGAFTITLPAASTATGLLLHIKKTDSSANRITIDGNASELVEDAVTQQLIYQGENLMLQCDGTQWWVL